MHDAIFTFCSVLLETVDNVDDTLAEMFLEEIPPTEEQLIVSIVKIVGLICGWMD